MSSVAQKLRTSAIDTGQHAAKEKMDLIDFKMVTFSLAGKDYGIDIMKVKEIARFVNFTYVPNTPGFVRGVYNLRGEIISIIDLRAMFNLPYQQKASNEEEAGLILRLDNNLIGVVVDKIDKVVGINSAVIQPPHPIFGDINIKYISGVVENLGRLYIILDVERVLGKPEEKQSQTVTDYAAKANIYEPETVSKQIRQDTSGGNDDVQYRNFIAEALFALLDFQVSVINESWFNKRFAEWAESKSGQQIQIRTVEEAKEFLSTFTSPFTSQLWGPEYFNSFVATLPELKGNIIQVWNPGCGRGYETYSLAVALRTKYPDAAIKIWASDKDLLNISGAPNLVFAEREVPEIYKAYVTVGKNGLSFSQKIKDLILFEYHDISNNHGLPPMDIVVARDVISFMTLEQQKHLLREIRDLLKRGGYLMFGMNEIPPQSEEWSVQEHQHMHVGRKV